MKTSLYMDDFSAYFIMDLYRTRLKAEARQDEKALISLRQHYPELFTEEIENFIANVVLVAKTLDSTHGTDFSSSLELNTPEEKKDDRCFH